MLYQPEQTSKSLVTKSTGPGCSSIAYGATEEIGPFRINRGSNLYLNSFSWNIEANLLFLESPVGVGFSYTNTSSDFKEFGDERTVMRENRRESRENRRKSRENRRELRGEPSRDREENRQESREHRRDIERTVEKAPSREPSREHHRENRRESTVEISRFRDRRENREIGREEERSREKRDPTRKVFLVPKSILPYLFFGHSRYGTFPQYQYRDFYIAGESYAGHYVPQLAKKINEYNKAFNKPTINIKGFMVGNPDMDKNNDKLGTITYWWSHAMISDTNYNLILRNCNFTADSFSKECNSSIYNAAADFGEIDQYSIYTPKCVRMKQMRKAVLARQTTEYDPCTESYADIYYNRPDVQRAMHANQTAIPYKWTACSDPVFNNWNWRLSDNSMLPIYKELMEAGLRIWVYSGDTDSVIPVTATRFSISKLNLPVKTRWYPWYSGNQVGGRTEVYEGLTFVTVRGAGHEVPLFKPQSALILLKYFLAGKELPRSY
uniref:Carboxypeptidase n=1 Tax=Brassica campestris TaxID=3711 RepID=M4FDQ2_BRACM